MEYLILVDYESDAERKRIDYLLDKWEERARIRKPRGVVVIIDTEEPQRFIEELFSRLEGNVTGKVEVYSLKRLRTNIKPQRKSLGFRINEEKKVVERFVEYLMSKLNANYLGVEDGFKSYSVYTRKGSALIRVLVKGDGNSRVVFEVEGYGDAVDFLAQRISEELELFAGD